MRFGIYIISAALLFSLGTHVNLTCEMPMCAMSGAKSCTCPMGNDMKSSMKDSCCKPEVKCETSKLDGSLITQTNLVFTPVIEFHLTSLPINVSDDNSSNIFASNPDPPNNPILSRNNLTLLI